MSIERIPCGGWDIDTIILQFQNKVLKAVGGITGAYLPLSGGRMGADAMIQGTDNLEIVVGDNSVESSVVGVTQNGVTIEHNTDSNIDSSLRIIENTIELTADNNTITLNGTGVDLSGTNVTGIGSLTGVEGAEIVIETTLDMNNHNIINVDTPVNPDDVVNKQYVDNVALGYLKISGGSLTGTLSMGNNRITNLAEPVDNQDVATKNYVDTKLLENLTAYRIRDLFGVPASKEQNIILPDKRENVAVVYYSVNPDGTANISNSRAITVQAGQTVETRDNFTVKFSDDMITITFTNIDTTNSILGQYYGYNA